MIDDTFDSRDSETWTESNFAVAASWNQTAWSADYVSFGSGEVQLSLDGIDSGGKAFTGSELQSRGFYSYGSYEVEMRPSDTPGVVSSFFLYNNDFFGAAKHNEIDIEFLGTDTTQIHLNYFYGNARLSDTETVVIDLGFDAADAMHTYRIDWLPEGISWFVDDVLIYSVDADTAPLPIPDEGTKVFMNLWTGGNALESWHGPVDPNATAHAAYSAVRYDAVLTDIVGTASADDLRPQNFMPGRLIGFEGDDKLQGYYFDDVLLGGAGRDWLRGYGGDDTLDGGAGADDIDGGVGADVYVWGPDSLGARDRVDAFMPSEGDVIDLTGFAAAYGWSAAEAEAAVVIETSYKGTYVSVVVPDQGKVTLVELRGIAPDEISVAAGTLRLVSGPPAGTADDDGNMALRLGTAMEDAVIEPGEEGAVTLTLSGLDADAGAVITVSDGTTQVSSGLVGADGTVTLDLSSLTDGPATTSVTATDAEGNTTTVAGPALSLDFAPDLSADEDGNLGIDAPDTFIDGSEAGAVTLTATGIDADASAVITVSDGSLTLSSGPLVAGAQSAVFDLSGFANGSITTSIVASDGSGNVTAPVAGPGLTLDTSAEPEPVPANAIIGDDEGNGLSGSGEADYIVGLGGNDYIRGYGGDDTLDGGAGADNIDGGVGADVYVWGPDSLGARDRVDAFMPSEGDVIDLTGFAAAYGWSAAEAEAAVVIETSYKGTYVSVVVPDQGKVTLVELRGIAPDEISVAAGTLRLVSGPPAGTADDDGNMALRLGTAMEDAVIEPGEEGAVTLTLSGLDADAGAVITVSDGTTQVSSGLVGADGTVTLDLSSLTDGPATTSVTATDAEGNTTTVAGPALSLDFAPDLSADEDGNLGIDAPDTFIDGSEAGAVTLTATGIDADASAVITVSDGSLTLSSGPLVAGAQSAVFDLSGFANGSITTSIVASDGSGNVTAPVAGPGLTLDTSAEPEPVPANAIIGDDEGNGLSGSGEADYIVGLGGNDYIRGYGGDDTLDGGAGADNIDGGVGADVYVWGPDSLGARDRVDAFMPSEGDVIDLTGFAAAYGWSAAEAEAAVVIETSYKGTYVSVVVPDQGKVTLVELRGIAPDEISVAAGTLRLVSGPPAGTADDDGNMALRLGTAMEDAVIEPGEEGAVTLTLSGLDADAGAVITVSDGTTQVSSGLVGADGTVTLDLSSLTDGPATTSVTATDAEGNTTTVAGPALSLDFAPDLSADEDGNLGIDAPDTFIDGSEAGAVTLTATGIDADASAVITVSDGSLTLSSGPLVAGAQSAVFDLSGFANGSITTSIVASDGSGNVTAPVAGPGLTLDTSAEPEPEPVPANAIIGDDEGNGLSGSGEADYIVGLGGNDYIRGYGGDDTLDGGAGADNIDGGVGADVYVWGPDSLGARDRVDAFMPSEGDVIDLTGFAAAYGWSAAEAEAAVVIETSYKGTYVSVVVPDQGKVTLVELRGIAPDEISVAAGTLRLVSGPPAGTADDDGNMALRLGTAMEDAVIEPGEEGAVTLTLSGLDADAGAVITVSDGTTQVSSGLVGADGTVTLDLSSLTDGPATTSVTATDAEGNTTTVAGPALYMLVDGAASEFLAPRSEALIIDLVSGRYAEAAKVLPIGDSLTQGIVDGTEPAAERDGYRGDLLEKIIAGGGWIDYVGAFSNGPSTMLDTDHSGEPGIPLRLIVDNRGRDADLSDNLAEHDPVITLLMAGTNDFDFRSGNFFSVHLPGILENTEKAVTQFYAQTGAEEKYLVVSTLAPKLANDVPANYAHMINDGYSILNGVEVPGDAGNGTWVPGLRSLVEGLQQDHPTLLLFDNPHADYPSSAPQGTVPPEATDHLSVDKVHYTDAAYGEYAEALYALVEAQTGLFSGIHLDWQDMPTALDDIVGGRAGDRIIGNDRDNVIDGGSGADLIEGGLGADTFVFAFDDSTDRIVDFSALEGDVLDVSAISSGFGWDRQAAELAFSFEETEAGLRVDLTDPDDMTFSLAYLQDVTLANFTPSNDMIFI